ncbi:MAG: Bax inhibitor-1/YccA family protein [Bacteroidales bacterium]|nr:Bax inhibitor-1/YccA family protein [Bacteroidales bacterium]MCF8387779.1 Bax inhibitor-1/YccA family protein [Bacteroidales bacterium]MCF8398163.1 Bax inhibitor-1/YccA family protein [Bacteroidales bacterium]
MDRLTRNKDFELDLPKEQEASVVSTFMANVFLWMFMALAITGLTAYWVSTSTEILSMIYRPETGAPTMLGWIVFLSPIGFVLLMSAGFHKLSASTLTILFLVFALILGLSLSSIFLVYTAASLTKTFFITAGMFGLMAVVGYTTKTDLTRFGSLMMMGLFGIIIAMVVNFFLNSSTLDYIISIIGVLVFTGLTAYDVQMLKKVGSGQAYDYESTRKLVIIGALRLYLDFINLFLFLLRLFGNRR